MSVRIEFDAVRCVGCGACAVACADQNDLEPGCVQDFLRKVTVQEQGSGMAARFAYRAEACRHCDPAPCMESCPMSCIFRDGETGFMVYDNTNCIGCGACAAACPFGAPAFGPDGKMRKCDGCYVRVWEGLEPACVRVCPFDALKLVET